MDILWAMLTARLIAIVLLAIAVTACSGRRAAAPQEAFAAYAETDFAGAPDAVYSEAAHKLSQAIGQGLSDLPGARAYGPKDVLPVLAGHLLVAAEPGEDAELLVLALASSDGVAWTQDIPLASGTLIKGSSIAEQAGAQLVRIQLAGGVADAIYFGLSPVGPALLRAEAKGAVVNAAFRAANPQVTTSPGKLGGDDVVAQLAATMHLAGPDQAAARGKPAVTGHLKALAGSTNTWLAQAAADLLTLPVE